MTAPLLLIEYVIQIKDSRNSWVDYVDCDSHSEKGALLELTAEREQFPNDELRLIVQTRSLIEEPSRK